MTYLYALLTAKIRAQALHSYVNLQKDGKKHC
jgi:hypothetical protein